MIDARQLVRLYGHLALQTHFHPFSIAIFQEYREIDTSMGGIPVFHCESMLLQRINLFRPKACFKLIHLSGRPYRASFFWITWLDPAPS